VLSRLPQIFNHRFLSGDRFGQSNFFRQFLETELHGTGHLFPNARREGWVPAAFGIAVNVSDRRLVNFNPCLRVCLKIVWRRGFTKIKETLLQIPPGHAGSIAISIALEGRWRKVFQHLSPVRAYALINNSATRAADVSFVDVEEDIQQIETLLGHFERQKFSTISLKRLNELERPFFRSSQASTRAFSVTPAARMMDL